MGPIWENIETDFTLIIDGLIYTAQCGTNVEDNIQHNGQNTLFKTNVTNGSFWEGTTTSNRSEMGSFNGPAFSNSDDIWISYSMKIDADSGPLMDAYVGQLHDLPGMGDAPADPPFAVQLVNRMLSLEIRASTVTPLPSNPQPVVPAQFNITYGVWYDFVFQIRLDPSGGGLVKWWVNGELKLDWQGAIGFASTTECYWKFGIYDIPQTYYRSVWWANIESGTTSLLARVDDPLPLPEGAVAVTLLPYDEVNPSQIFSPRKTITNFPVALVNNLIERLNVSLQRLEDDITNNYALMLSNYAFAADAFFQRIPAQDEMHENAYRAMIDGLVIDGVWAKLDALWIFKAAGLSEAITNLVSANYGITLAENVPGDGFPTFVADGYFQGDGTQSYLNTGFNPVQEVGAKYTLNSASFGTWNLLTAQDNGASMGTANGVGQSQLWPRYTDDLAYYAVNQDTTDTIASTDGSGFFIASRTGASAVSLDRNGVKLDSSTTASSSLRDEYLSILFGGDYYNGRVSAAFIGGGLTDAEMIALYDRVAAYMAAIT